MCRAVGRCRAGCRLVAEVERCGGGEAGLYDLRQEDAGGGRAVDAGGDAHAGRVAVLQGRGGDAVRWPRTVLNNHLEWLVLK